MPSSCPCWADKALLGVGVATAAAAVGLYMRNRSLTARCAELEAQLAGSPQAQDNKNSCKGSKSSSGAATSSAAQTVSSHSADSGVSGAVGAGAGAGAGAVTASAVAAKPVGKSGKPGKPVRVYLDGCFDLMHYGHFNALRQAKAHGDILVAGIHTDEDILANKGCLPVMNFEERVRLLRAVKFVDEVIEGAPYSLSKEWIVTLVEDHQVDFVLHGDDLAINADGGDAYGVAKSMGVFKTIKRTEGVSTTDIVGRMLLMSREHHLHGSNASGVNTTSSAEFVKRARSLSSENIPDVAVCKFLPTSRRLVQFSEGRAPKPDDKVVYVAGTWDILNGGHIAFLKEAKKLGDFLLVGIHDDDTVNAQRGSGFPILNVHERALSLLACRYVDEVVIAAPYEITEDMIKTMNISAVAHGTVSDKDVLKGKGSTKLSDPYAIPRERGMLTVIPSANNMTALAILRRIAMNRSQLQARYDKKAKSEAEYHQNKEYHEEV